MTIKILCRFVLPVVLTAGTLVAGQAGAQVTRTPIMRLPAPAPAPAAVNPQLTVNQIPGLVDVRVLINDLTKRVSALEQENASLKQQVASANASASNGAGAVSDALSKFKAGQSEINLKVSLRMNAMDAASNTRFGAQDTRFNAVDTRFTAQDAAMVTLSERVEHHKHGYTYMSYDGDHSKVHGGWTEWTGEQASCKKNNPPCN
jgi:hypothetical protein